MVKRPTGVNICDEWTVHNLSVQAMKAETSGVLEEQPVSTCVIENEHEIDIAENGALLTAKAEELAKKLDHPDFKCSNDRVKDRHNKYVEELNLFRQTVQPWPAGLMNSKLSLQNWLQTIPSTQTRRAWFSSCYQRKR